MSFSTTDIPRLDGKFAIVTGANSGIGFETALELSRAGAEVILAGRSEGKTKVAVGRILAQYSGAKVRWEALDLASLASVEGFAGRLATAGRPVDVLVNNAGVMALPVRTVTADGFEMQLGVNFLGHFALTGRLLPLLKAAGKARVVQVSSIAHKRGAIQIDDLQAERRYSPWAVYNQSKLAMLMFGLALQRRADVGGWGILSAEAHPGVARTELVANGPGMGGMMGLASKVVFPLISHSAAAGALPTLYAATAPGVKPGGYYGPMGFMELKGAVGPAKIMKQALDVAMARRLWEAAERLTGVAFISGP